MNLRTLARQRFNFLAGTILIGGCLAVLFSGCLSKEDAVMWPPEVKNRIRKVTPAELIQDFKVEAERLRTAGLPQERKNDWTARQTMQSLLRALNQATPGDMFELEDRLGRLGLVSTWYEVAEAGQTGNSQPQKWIVWIHEPFGKYSGSGMYYYRFPNNSGLGVGLPAGFENNPLTESAFELFVRSPQIVTLAINTPSHPMPRKAGKDPVVPAQPPLYQTYVQTWLSTSNGVFWLDLCTYPRVAASENLYLGAVTIAGDGKNKPLTGYGAETCKKLLEAGLTVETLGDGLEVTGLKLPPAATLLADFATQAKSAYLLLAFPTTVFDHPQRWLEQMQKALPMVKQAKNPREGQ